MTLIKLVGLENVFSLDKKKKIDKAIFFFLQLLYSFQALSDSNLLFHTLPPPIVNQLGL